MDFALWIECSALSDINYETMNSGNTMTLSVNPIVEKCLAKMANDVTTQVRDKLVDIIIAVLTREFEDFDGETVRRHIYAELESTPIAFALEKHVAAASKTPKTKVVELDADGNAVKKVRTPKEPKAPKAAKAPKAPKPVLTEEEREALKAAKQAEREAAKEARKAEKVAAKDADKEAAKEAAKAEKAAAKAEREAEKAAAKEAAKAEKEAAKLAKPAKEQRLPIPWCGKRIPGRCEALRAYHGLFAQCTADATEISAFCPSCEKSGAPFGTCAMRAACGIFDYVAPNGKKCVRLANVIQKFGFPHEQFFQEEAAELNITIPYEHLEKEVKQRGRPKSSSPRARPAATAAKIATSDTGSGSGSETETDDEEYQAKQQQKQQRKKVAKTAAAAATDAAPKKRGRPAKAKEAAPEPKDDLIQGLVASAKKAAATPKAKSAPASPELSEDEVTPVAVVAAAVAKPKLAAKPKAAVAKPKAPERKVIEMDGENFWVEQFNGEQVLVRCSDNYAFNLSGEGLGVWDNKTKTITEDEESSCDEE